MDKRAVIEEKRQKFREILLELSENQAVLKSPDERRNYYKRFNELYSMEDGQKHFRHYYSDIFSVLLMVEDNSQADIDTLGQNIAYLAQNYDSKVSSAQNNIDVSDELQKLYDHVSLDIARINYSKRGDDRLAQEETIIALTEQANETKAKYEILTSELSKTQDTLNNSQKEYIAILGIFASIVLAFVGGLTFSTSVLNNIQSTNIYKLVLVALVIGFVFITVIYYLFHYTGVLTGKIRSTHRQLRPLAVSYIVIIAMIIAVVASWRFGFVEKRNANIEKQLSQLETSKVVDEVDACLPLETDINSDLQLIEVAK